MANYFFYSFLCPFTLAFRVERMKETVLIFNSAHLRGKISVLAIAVAISSLEIN